MGRSADECFDDTSKSSAAFLAASRPYLDDREGVDSGETAAEGEAKGQAEGEAAGQAKE